MHFAPDTEIGLNAATALVNTEPGRESEQDGLPDVAALRAFVREWGWTGRLDGTDAELRQVRQAREQILRLWRGDEAQTVEVVNELLRQAQAVPQLVRHDDWDWHVHATTADAPLATRMIVEAAMAFLDLVRGDALDRRGDCAADDCDCVLIDLSRNRSRRYCDAGCGNRANVAAYRARRAGAESG